MHQETPLIWTKEGCSLCERVKSVLREAGEVEERSAEDLLAGRDRDISALSQLAMQAMQLPVVRMGERYLTAEELLEDHTALADCTGEACRIGA